MASPNRSVYFCKLLSMRGCAEDGPQSADHTVTGRSVAGLSRTPRVRGLPGIPRSFARTCSLRARPRTRGVLESPGLMKAQFLPPQPYACQLCVTHLIPSMMYGHQLARAWLSAPRKPWVEQSESNTPGRKRAPTALICVHLIGQILHRFPCEV